MKPVFLLLLLTYLGVSGCSLSGAEKVGTLVPTATENQSAVTHTVQPPLPSKPLSANTPITVETTPARIMETGPASTATIPPPPATETMVSLDNPPRLASAIISANDIINASAQWYFEDFSLPYLQATDATSELLGNCLLDCAKQVLHGRHDTLTIILMRAGNSDKAKRTVAALYNDFMQLSYPYEYIAERKFVNAPVENTWIVATSSDDYSLGVSYGSVVILLKLHVPGTDDGPGQVGLISEFANLQLGKLNRAGFSP